jgi:hypothetical protein
VQAKEPDTRKTKRYVYGAIRRAPGARESHFLNYSANKGRAVALLILAKLMTRQVLYLFFKGVLKVPFLMAAARRLGKVRLIKK